MGRGRGQVGREDRAQGKGEQKCDDHWRDTGGPRESVFSFFKVSTVIAYLYAKKNGSVERNRSVPYRIERECCRSNGLEWQEGLGSGLGSKLQPP